MDCIARRGLSKCVQGFDADEEGGQGEYILTWRAVSGFEVK